MPQPQAHPPQFLYRPSRDEFAHFCARILISLFASVGGLERIE
jgi:hypothetical protein